MICSLFFYGYGLGHWGMPRGQQVLFVAVVYTAQVAFSHWWLARFHYGPMEWLWRGFSTTACGQSFFAWNIGMAERTP